MLEYRPGTPADVIAAASSVHGVPVGHLWSCLRSALTSLFHQGSLNVSLPSRLQDGSRDFRAHNADYNTYSSSSEKQLYVVPQWSMTTSAPIHTLPPEILGEVFALCVPELDSDAFVTYNSSARDSAPLLLLQVCRTWQRVALGTPQLWTKLGLHGIHGVNPLALVTTWLRRSGALPIDVYINPLSWQYPIHLDVFKNFIIPETMKLLAADFHRVRTFHTTNFPAVLQGLFPDGSHINAPLLREFRILPSPKSSGYMLAGQITAPHLEALEVCDPHITLQSITPNHNNLLHIRWNGSNVSNAWHASVDSLVHLLRSCPNLEECDIIRPRRFDEFLSPRTTISLPRLRRLSMLWKDTVDIADLLHLLEVPALESLRLEMEHATSTRANLKRVLAALFPSHGPIPPLKELHAVHLDTIIPGDTPHSNAFVPTLTFPCLESLRLEDCSLHTAFLAALTPEPESPPSSWNLPRLSALHLSRADLDGPRLVRMVAARTKAASPFRVLSLSNCRGISSLDNAVLRTIAGRAGLITEEAGTGDQDVQASQQTHCVIIMTTLQSS